MHGPINVISPNNISKWQMGFNLAFEGLISKLMLFYSSVSDLFFQNKALFHTHCVFSYQISFFVIKYILSR
jgi:hypothetical protein